MKGLLFVSLAILLVVIALQFQDGDRRPAAGLEPSGLPLVQTGEETRNLPAFEPSQPALHASSESGSNRTVAAVEGTTRNARHSLATEATIQVKLRDIHGQPVWAASLYAERSNHQLVVPYYRIARTNRQGYGEFVGVPFGFYRIHAVPHGRITPEGRAVEGGLFELSATHPLQTLEMTIPLDGLHGGQRSGEAKAAIDSSATLPPPIAHQSATAGQAGKEAHHHESSG